VDSSRSSSSSPSEIGSSSDGPPDSSPDDIEPPWDEEGAGQRQEATDRPWLHLLLFGATLVTTVYAGGQWVGRWLYYEAQGETISLIFMSVPQAWLVDGVRYAIPLLGFLTVHEFGHYFAARHHRVNTSLPYYIPFIPQLNPIGTFGAVISIRQAIPSTRKLFDIGVAGPLAGFVVALGALLYGFATLPPPEYLLDLQGHEVLKEHIRQHGTFPTTPPEPSGNAIIIVIGQTPLFWLFSQFFANVPPMYEIYHYPVLFAGWLGLFFTALNLLPVGQLDGGHVLYALLGSAWHRRFAQVFVFILLLSGGVGFMQDIRPRLYEMGAIWGHLSWGILAVIYAGYLYRIFGGVNRSMLLGTLGLMVGVGGVGLVGPTLTQYGYSGWLFFALLIVFLIRVEHPPVVNEQKLTPTRRMLGYLAIAIFILCFSIRPITTL